MITRYVAKGKPNKAIVNMNKSCNEKSLKAKANKNKLTTATIPITIPMALFMYLSYNTCSFFS